MKDLVDAHLHLQDPAFAGEIDQVIDRAHASGVRWFVCNGTRESDWPAVAALARAHPAVIPCFGLHPWYVADRSPAWLETLERALREMPSAVGEIGLDRWIEPRHEPDQETVFRAQLDLARHLNRPVMVHCLRAWGWLMDVLKTEPALPAGMLLHAYGGSTELIGPLAERGAYFSFAGNAFEPRRAAARAALVAVPADRLLIETDAPDLLPPESLRQARYLAPDGKERNEPANLFRILEAAAQVRQCDPEDLAASTRDAACRLFGAMM